MTDITSATGVSLAWTEYTPFGTPRAAAATSQAPLNPFRFSGEYQDPTTALYHLRARQYDPTTGRFTATDPLSPGIGEPVVGAYVYVANNPVRYTDPSGRESQAAGKSTGSCWGAQLAGALAIAGMGFVEFGLGVATVTMGPEIHGLLPLQIIDRALIGGNFAAIGTIIYFNSHPCP